MKKHDKAAPARRPSRRRLSASGNGSAQAVRGHLISPAELARLQERLRELTETVEALRTGAVDAVVVSGPNGNQIYSLVGAEHPYRVYVERMQEGAVTVSSEGVILYTNQRFADMLLLPLERVIGSDIRPCIGPESWREISRVLRHGTEPVKYVSPLHREGRPPLPVSLSASGLEIEGQEMLCLVVTDLTDQNETSELRIAKEIAEKANLAKDDFLAALSHELRTPLTPALVSAANLASDPSLPEHLRNEVAVMRRNVELEARLIDDLLDLTRIAHGKLELHHARMDLHAVLDEAINICQPEIAAKRLRLRVQKDAPRAEMDGDPVRIQQVLWNLLRNAVKFTPEEGSVCIHTSQPSPDEVAIEISDTGIGFKSSASEKLFHAFEQGDRQITRLFGGLGLGLAISRSIAAAHGGTIDATSPGSGQGATFRLHLPRRTSAQETPTPSPDLAASPGLRAGLRILLVEDHQDTRTVLEHVLRRHEHHVVAAADARGALEIAEHHQFDVVISDLGLPDQSGLELMRQLRDRFGLRGIAVSGYGMEEDVAKSHSAGFVHHMTKPISVDRLHQLIGKLGIDRGLPTPSPFPG